MNCERRDDWSRVMLDVLEAREGTSARDLDGGAREDGERLDAHLAECSECRGEFDELERVWRGLTVMDEIERNTIPVPSERMRRRFGGWLEGQLETGGRAAETVRRFEPRPARAVPAASPTSARVAWLSGLAATLVVGLWLGARLERSGAETLALRAEVGSLRQMVALSLLQQPQASQRLAGVRYGRGITEPDASVVDSLFDVVGADPNVNVRLAAVEALGDLLPVSGQATPTAPVATSVEAKLFDAFQQSSSPLVQVAIAAALLDRPSTKLEAERRFGEALAQGQLDPSVAAFLKRRLGVAA
jgi:hypothetical protein